MLYLDGQRLWNLIEDDIYRQVIEEIKDVLEV